MKPHIEVVVSDRKIYEYAVFDGEGKKVAVMETRDGAEFALSLLKHQAAESDRTED